MIYVIKRNGRKEKVKFDKIVAGILKMCYGLSPSISPEIIAIQAISHLYNGIHTAQLDELCAQIAFSNVAQHPDYAILATRIAVSNLHKQTCDSFSDLIEAFYQDAPEIDSKQTCISASLYELVFSNKEQINQAIDHTKDFHYDYLQFQTLCTDFLMRIEGEIVERPQHFFMRIALGIHKHDLKVAIPTYLALSGGKICVNTTTMQRAGTSKPQFASHYMTSIKKGTIDSVHELVSLCEKASSSPASIGISLQETTGNISSLLDLLISSGQYIRDVSGENKQTKCVFLEPWHLETESFLEYIHQVGDQDSLEFALLLPDLFMDRVLEGKTWSYFAPQNEQTFAQKTKHEFIKDYLCCEQTQRGTTTVYARSLWDKILQIQIKTNKLHLFFKDNINLKYDQNHLGSVNVASSCGGAMATIQDDETASVISTSINLAKFIAINGQLDEEALFEACYLGVLTLNKMTDENHYLSDSLRRFHLRHRPIHLHVHGLSDAYILLNIPYNSLQAKKLNLSIFETIYFACLSASNDLSKLHGAYSSFNDSMLSRGIFQFNKWNIKPSTRWNWEQLRSDIKQYGVRNSLLIALGWSASYPTTNAQPHCMPYYSYVNQTNISLGQVSVFNEHLARHLIKKNLWSEEIRQKLLQTNGSLHPIELFDSETKQLFCTTQELDPKIWIDQAADRAAFICQSEQLIFPVQNIDKQTLSDLHFYAWKRGLKSSVRLSQ